MIAAIKGYGQAQQANAQRAMTNEEMVRAILGGGALAVAARR